MSAILRTKKEVVTEFRTAGILEAARKVFAKKGFSDATVDDIANAAGVAKGTIYLYYKSKRDVYFAALKFGLEQMYSALAEPRPIRS
jgi:AcrR family transcriptional regulator